MRRVARSVGLAVAVALVALGAAQLAVGGGGTQSVPSVHGLLEGVSCSSSRACMAVGGISSPFGEGRTLAERWVGHGWSIQRTPNPSGTPDSSLVGVSCPSAAACIAVGETNSSNGRVYVPFTERWNGHRWSIEPIPHQNQWYLYGVSCSSRTNCIAVGIRGGHQPGPLAERWDGNHWSVQRTADPAGRSAWLYGVSCSAPNACTAVGFSGTRTLAERWNGRRWSIQSTPNATKARSSTLQDVSCPSSTACTAVGYEDVGHQPPFVSLTLVERWNGHRWLIQSTPASARSQGTILHGVSCPSTRSCTAVGQTESGFDDSLSLAERWNGHRWSIKHLQRAKRPNLLLSVSCLSARSCTAVGGSGDPRIDQEKPLVEQSF
jgi:hypothetical protein